MPVLAGNGYSTRGIKWTHGGTYWINLHYDAFTGTCFVAAFDPDRGFAQLGTTITAPAVLGSPMNGTADFGRTDNHGTDNHNNGQSYVGHICIDYTNGAFPLLLSGGSDTTAPSAPAVVRDGTGADQSIALSSTQLSTNWDPAWDAQSGIKGYQYTIGTTPGGTDVVPWTSLANVLGVTKTGLNLAPGQTYYFSVKAVNGAGLLSSVTTSKGQCLGTDTTPPSARRQYGTEESTGPWERIAMRPLPPRSCRATLTRPPMPKAESRVTSMPSAPRPAARKPSLGNQVFPAMRT